MLDYWASNRLNTKLKALNKGLNIDQVMAEKAIVNTMHYPNGNDDSPVSTPKTFTVTISDESQENIPVSPAQTDTEMPTSDQSPVPVTRQQSISNSAPLTNIPTTKSSTDNGVTNGGQGSQGSSTWPTATMNLFGVSAPNPFNPRSSPKYAHASNNNLLGELQNAQQTLPKTTWPPKSGTIFNFFQLPSPSPQPNRTFENEFRLKNTDVGPQPMAPTQEAPGQLDPKPSHILRPDAQPFTPHPTSMDRSHKPPPKKRANNAATPETNHPNFIAQLKDALQAPEILDLLVAKNSYPNTQSSVSTQEMQNKIENLTKDYENLWIQHQKLLTTVDQINQRIRMSSLKINDVPEQLGENTVHLALDIINTMGIPLTIEYINKCQRIGPRRTNKIRPILIELSSQYLRKQVFLNKSNLYNTVYRGAFITEDLTPDRSNLLFQARNMKRNGRIESCWSKEGEVYIQIQEGGRETRLRNLDDLKANFHGSDSNHNLRNHQDWQSNNRGRGPRVQNRPTSREPRLPNQPWNPIQQSQQPHNHLQHGSIQPIQGSYQQSKQSSSNTYLPMGPFPSSNQGRHSSIPASYQMQQPSSNVPPSVGSTTSTSQVTQCSMLPPTSSLPKNIGGSMLPPTSGFQRNSGGGDLSTQLKSNKPPITPPEKRLTRDLRFAGNPSNLQHRSNGSTSHDPRLSHVFPTVFPPKPALPPRPQRRYQRPRKKNLPDPGPKITNSEYRQKCVELAASMTNPGGWRQNLAHKDRTDDSESF
jgi:hypothetical protein